MTEPQFKEGDLVRSVSDPRRTGTVVRWEMQVGSMTPRTPLNFEMPGSYEVQWDGDPTPELNVDPENLELRSEP